MNNRIVFVSGNKGKIREVQEILNEYEVISIKDLNVDFDVKEDQDTFLGNALKKARESSKKLNGEICLADDSGIEIESLNGFPGVYTKRWIVGTDRERNLEILKKMEGFPKEKRKVRFISAIAVKGENAEITGVSSIDGYVSENPRGQNGFGFDEIFELENGKTLAELSSDEKNNISARRKALEMVKNKMKSLLN